LLLLLLYQGVFFAWIENYNTNYNHFLKNESILFFILEHKFCSRIIGSFLSFLLLTSINISFTWLLQKIKKSTKNKYVMGTADPILFSGIISFLGFNKISLVLLLSSIQGLLFGIIYLKIKYNNQLKILIPFGPFLSLASFEIILFT